jgi:myosin V
VLQQCIHAPRTSHMSRSGRMPQHGDDSPWKVLLKVLQTLHEQLDSNEVPKFLRRKLFLQLFSFINVQLFNQLLLRRECCSFANGEYVKQGLGQVRFA